MQQFLSNLAQRFPSSEFYVSLPFWGCFALAAIIYRLAPRRPTVKQCLLLLTSITMLLTIPRFNPLMLAVLGGLCLFAYTIGQQLNNGALASNQARRILAVGGILGVVCVLAFFKYNVVQDVFLRPNARAGVAATDFIFLIGISYSSFKAMHFIIEGHKKGIKNSSLLGFFNYILFFPAFISGPINRYNHFCENTDIQRTAALREDLSAGLQRIVHGLFKKIVLVSIVSPYTIKNMGIPVQQMAFLQIVLGFYALALYFYFDFSGYTDLAIGAARVMGFVLPENFDYPFLKKNIQQLWANWHMSLTSWLTDYVYWPLVRKLRNAGFLRRHPVLLSNVAIVVTFAICGIWHGNTLNFALWGMYQGVGIAAVNTYQTWKRKVRNPVARKYFTSSYSYALGLFATFNFFAIGQSLFVLNSEQIRTLLGRLL